MFDFVCLLGCLLEWFVVCLLFVFLIDYLIVICSMDGFVWLIGCLMSEEILK